MSRFQVRFYKEVTSDTGQDIDACQATFDLKAATEQSAVEQAKRRFCEEHQIRNWQVHADRIEVEALTVPDHAEADNGSD
jgi:hypothetical protein